MICNIINIIISSLMFITVMIVHSNGTGAPSASVYTTVKTREHEPIFLPCYAGNLGSNSIRWLHDDKLVTDAGEILVKENYKLHVNNTLEVIDVTETLSGAYVCQVIRPPPMTPIRHNYIIQVLHPPKLWMSPSQNEVEVQLNQEVTLYCNATGFPQPFITWNFNGEEIAEMRNQNTLTFVVTKENSGEYSCIASNGVGNSDVNSIMVSAVYSPIVKADKMLIHTSRRETTVIECIIDGSPPPKVEWFMNNKFINKDPRISYYKKGNRYGIEIRASRLSDVGHYMCVASNKLGRSKLSIEVSALANVTQFKTIQEKFEDRVILIWEVESYSPIIQYHLLFRPVSNEQGINDKPTNWTKLTIPADDSSGSPIHTQSYTLIGLDKATYYEACIIPKNLFGWSKPSNIYKFSTAGLSETTDIITTEEGTESNTITDFISDYATDYEDEMSEPSISRAKKRIHSPIYFFPLTFLWLGMQF